MLGVGVLALFVAAAGLVAAAWPRSSPRAADRPSDAWLTMTARIAILTSTGARGSEVLVDTTNATMTLYGKVASPADKASVEQVARSVEGVREVRSFLMVASLAKDSSILPLDSDLRSEVAVALIAAGLKKDHALSGSKVSVQSVDEGTVWLSGTVDSLAAHLEAIETAQRVPGVHAVRSNIQSPDARAVYGAPFLGR